MRRVADRYQLVRQVGTGGSGTVWEGYDDALERIVAVKVIAPSSGVDTLVRRAVREFGAVARLDVPETVRMHDFVEEDGRLYLVMEYLSGRSLDHILKWRQPTMAESCAVGAALCRALAAVHGLGVVHRDVKPANVMVCNDDRVVLTDFGIAKDSRAYSQLTSTNAVIGTPMYMAPEMIVGDEVGPAADVYALGCVLFLTLSGLPPYADAGKEFARLLFAKVSRDPMSLRDVADPGVPDALVQLVDAMLSRDPQRRPAVGDCAEMLASRSGDASPSTMLVGIEDDAPDEGTERAAEPITVPQDESFQGSDGLPFGAPQPAVLSTGVIERPWWADASEAARGPGRYSDPLEAVGVWAPGDAGTGGEVTASRVADVVVGSLPHAAPGVGSIWRVPAHRIDSRYHEAVALAERGELVPALRLHEDVARLRAELLGADHPLTLASRFWVAWCLAELGEYERADTLLLRVSDQTDRVIGAAPRRPALDA